MNTLRHEELYRTSGLLEKMAQLEIVMCGAGAVGSNLTENLSRQGFKKFTIIDMDRIEDHNRQTQIWTSRDVGQFKANILKNHIFNSMGIVATVHPKKLEESNIKKFLNTSGVVIDGFDNVESRKLVTTYCKKNSIECLHIGLSKDYAEVIWNDSYRVPDDKNTFDVCEYPLARNIVMLAITVATESLISFADDKKRRNFVITLKDFKIMAI